MSSKKVIRRTWTQREDALAALLFRTPVTAEQIYEVSQTWQVRFASQHVTYRRLRELCAAGWVFRSPLAIASPIGAKHYYQLTLDGYRMWRRDAAAAAPSKRFFAPKGQASHQHLLAKAEFLSHLTIAAYRRGFTIGNDRPENTFAVTIGDVTIWPDHYCELVGPYGRRFRRFFEIDRSTETLVSHRTQQDTWSQKNLVYDAHQNLLGRERRFRVVPVVTESRQRLDNILTLFGQQTSNRDRQLYVGVCLADFVRESDALCHPLFHDHIRKHVPLIPLCAIGLPSPLTPAREERLILV